MKNLDEATIRSLLQDAGVTDLERVEVFGEIDSTNTYLRQQSPPTPGNMSIVVADHQTAGRGRSNNRWISAPGRSICLSAAYTFKQSPQNLPTLTLALGVAVAELLVSLGGDNVGLKWPNDILIDDSKLGGILTEGSHSGTGSVSVVAGIGLNVELPEEAAALAASRETAPPIDVYEALANPPQKEALAVAIVQSWQRVFEDYDANGFQAYLQRFRAFDWLAGKQVAVDTASGEIEGVAYGVNKSGALRVRAGGSTHEVVSGSIRSVSDA